MKTGEAWVVVDATCAADASFAAADIRARSLEEDARIALLIRKKILEGVDVTVRSSGRGHEKGHRVEGTELPEPANLKHPEPPDEFRARPPGTAAGSDSSRTWRRLYRPVLAGSSLTFVHTALLPEANSGSRRGVLTMLVKP